MDIYPGQFCKMVHSKSECLPRIANSYGLVSEEVRIFLNLIIIADELSINDHHNNLIIDMPLALFEDWPITITNAESCIGYD